jgi:hypothetical protein
MWTIEFLRLVGMAASLVFIQACACKPNEPLEHSLLLRDYAPRSMLHVPATEVPKAKFSVVDFDQHLQMHGEPQYVPPADIVRAMDLRNVKQMVHLGGGWGARGINIWNNLGLVLRDKSGKLLKVDDSRLDPIWQVCGELKIPVAIHVADPPALFARF